jgi:hypothetical protein
LIAAVGAKVKAAAGQSGGAVSEGTNSLAAAIADQATHEAFTDRIGGSESGLRRPSSFESSMVADVGAQYGGTLFNISSSTIQSMCGQQRLNCKLRSH